GVPRQGTRCATRFRALFLESGAGRRTSAIHSGGLIMASGIRDKVAILGMGCSRFGERWDADAEDLIVEAYEEALGDAGIETKQIEAAWFATATGEQHVGKSGVPPRGAVPRPYPRVATVAHCWAAASGGCAAAG